MVLSQPLWLLAILVLPVLWFVLKRIGRFGLPSVDSNRVGVGSRFLQILPRLLLSLAFIALCVALARPQRVLLEADQTVQARDIIIAVDRSGSMGAPIPGDPPKSVVGETELDREYPGKTANKDPTKPVGTSGRPGSEGGINRLQMAQVAVLDFIRNRYIVNAGDRVGLLLFDYSPYLSWPLTHDLKMIYRKIQFADDLGGGTNFGSSDPGPIDAAVDHFKELGQATSKVVILVTDGEDSLTPEAFDRLTKKLKDNGIRLYVIGVGPSLAERDVDIMLLARSVGGEVFRVEQAGDMQTVFRTIDQMERSSVSVYSTERRDERFAAFAIAAILLFVLACLGEAIVLNQ